MFFNRQRFRADYFQIPQHRKALFEGGHQTSIITTNQLLTLDNTAGSMFSRRSQENYSRYMIAEFNFDKMVQYGVETINENTKVVNPAYNKLTQQIKKATKKSSVPRHRCTN